ncbi:tRNA pseudouridine synthase A [Mangifera indica]|uniref:tRNA pseudouridine synthase A n=1 Tax=Mangifera indica TaxID=29780 RepID=UPI001CF933E7|nr:tRNA pseudouridine synthase A [Mangifera indica]
MTENPKQSLNNTPESSQRPVKIQKTVEDQTDNNTEQNPEEEEVNIPKPMNQNPKLQRYLVAIEYMGTRFSGSQKQLNCRTVVGVLEEAFYKFIGQPVSVSISSRTDAGVHALSNVCHVDVERISKRRPGEVLLPHEPTVVKKAVNHFLQREGDIMVTDVQCIPPDFHARFKAQERTYFYRLLSGPEPLSIFEKDRAWHVPEELDLHAMQEACKVLLGHHDFSSFRASGCQANSPIRTIDELHINEVISTQFPSNTVREQNNMKKEDSCVSDSISSATSVPISSICNSDTLGTSNGGSHLEFGIRQRHHNYVVKVRARSFLYHQVRLMVGVLKSVGTGDLSVSDVERILNAKTVTAASAMAPACGLYLGHVKYDLPQES